MGVEYGLLSFCVVRQEKRAGIDRPFLFSGIAFYGRVSRRELASVRNTMGTSPVRVSRICPNPFIAVSGSTRPSVVKVPSEVAESPSPRLTG